MAVFCHHGFKCVTTYLHSRYFPEKFEKASLLFKSILAIDCLILLILFCQLVHITYAFFLENEAGTEAAHENDVTWFVP